MTNLLTAEQLAERLGVTKDWVWKQAREGTIPSVALGRYRRFREDAIEQTWRVVQPLLDHPPPVRQYEPGSWGPREADRIVQGRCEWYQPWLPDDVNAAG